LDARPDNPAIGTWKLNVEQSNTRYSGTKEPDPYRSSDGDSVKYSFEGTSADGAR